MLIIAMIQPINLVNSDRNPLSYNGVWTVHKNVFTSFYGDRDFISEVPLQ